MQRFKKGPTLKKMLFFKVVFEKELDLTNVPETLKDELKQVQSVEVDEFLKKLKLMNLITMIILVALIILSR